MGVPSNIFGKQLATLDSVTFDVSRYEYQGVRDGAKVWQTVDGYGLGIFYFQRKPDIPNGLSNVSQLRESYADQLNAQFKIVECVVQSLDGIPSVRLIVRGTDPQTNGSVYVGSFTIPFREFSYVIKMQAAERGTTGMREALLVAQALKNGTGDIQDGKFVRHGWSFDDEQFDSLVPKHPLSRLREELRAIAESLRIGANVKKAVSFELPQNVA